MRINSKGQVTIPIEIRESAGFLPHTEVRFEMEGDVVRIRLGGEIGLEAVGRGCWNASADGRPRE